jgi:hypothetical protein
MEDKKAKDGFTLVMLDEEVKGRKKRVKGMILKREPNS